MRKTLMITITKKTNLYSAAAAESYLLTFTFLLLTPTLPRGIPIRLLCSFILENLPSDLILVIDFTP